MMSPELDDILTEPAKAKLLQDAVREARKRAGLARRQVATKGRYKSFQQKYRTRPDLFILDCVRWPAQQSPTEYQLEIAADLVQHGRESVRGPRGLGKTAIVSLIVHWFALTRDGEDWKIPTTASSWPQLTKFLWPEIHKWSRFLDWGKIGRTPYNPRTELLMLNLRLETGEAFAITSEKSELMEGAHADHILFIFDEAKSVADRIFDSAEGSLSGAVEGNEAYALAVSTPGAPLGRFYDIQSHAAGFEDWHARKVTKEEAIAAGRMTEEWCNQRAKQWGESSALYKNHVLGDFAAADENSVIPLEWVELAFSRWYEWEAAGFPGMFTGVGVDVGGGGEGSDKSVLAPAWDYVKIKELRKYERSDPTLATMELAGRVGGLLQSHDGLGEALVDVIGIGAGVAHRLTELGYRVRPFVASAGTDLRDSSGEYGFPDWRSAGWWMTREILDPQAKIPVCLPPDDELLGELTAPTYWVSSNGKIHVESKKAIRARLHRSTDSADAAIHILTGPVLNDERQRKKGARIIDFWRPLGSY